MKKILSLLGTITIIGTSTTSLVACNTTQNTEDELKKEKEKNNIKTKDGILEWIAPQETPFSQVDNKYYFVVWRGEKTDDWRIIKFKQIIYILSNYTYTKYAINKGYNDDVKLFSPYYFELISNPRELETGYWEFEHCKVKLNSSYFNFSGGPTPPTPINYWKEVYAKEKPFSQVDNKYYFVVWRGEKTDDWKIIKFKHSDLQEKILDSYNRFKLKRKIGLHPYPDLVIDVNIFNHEWWEFNINIYFKSVYRWNNDSEPNIYVENKLKSYLGL
ncbi:MAG: hypothetical protein SPLM_10600 [Spiroplasma phoeniceum]|uniref:lipoprotein n=1 Tax=Spiroplasma phoeniceum TaxID=47835 RepID=UPI00313402F7